MIKCYVETCSKILKNKLAVSHHIKMSAVNCLEHKKYLEDLRQKIVESFKSIDFNVFEICQQLNVGPAYVQNIWKEAFSKEQIKERQSLRLTRLNSKKLKQNQKSFACKNCNALVTDVKTSLRLFCNKKCYTEYQTKYPEKFAFTKGKKLEEIVGVKKAAEIKSQQSQTQQKKNPKTNLVCFKCKQEKTVTIFTKQQVLKKLNGKRYLCTVCKALKKHESKVRKYKCGNCKKPITRLISEKNNNKYVKTIKKFCNRKCFSEFYKNHPRRYLEQRRHAGHVSIQSFRIKNNFKYAGISFSSESERQTAIFLEKEFALKLEENKTCHVKINNIEVDFLINNIVVEYHQCYSNPQDLSLTKRIQLWRKNKYRYEYRTLDEYYMKRKKKIPSNYRLLVIQNVAQKTLKDLKETICNYQNNRSTT